MKCFIKLYFEILQKHKTCLYPLSIA